MAGAIEDSHLRRSLRGTMPASSALFPSRTLWGGARGGRGFVFLFLITTSESPHLFFEMFDWIIWPYPIVFLAVLFLRQVECCNQTQQILYTML